MELTLLINDKEEKFFAPAIKGRIFRKALEMNDKLHGESINVGMMDELIEFVCEAFGSQFTPDDVWDGLELAGMFPKLQEVFSEVVNQATKGVEGVSNSKKAKRPPTKR
ncbi:phage tail assembly chaperone G [Neobacillus sp.]|uniref:phage tail assembly chaperone G n=1 Tax=Neobacillus sp. TaxID=2675273 RepID=UPI0028A0E757|nr:hypothetical protein [Neobacillus sp.]